jgi:hypothetical protein
MALGVIVHVMAASAASGLPPTITMNPGQAGPGSQVEVLGLDFPAATQVELLLTTTAGPVPLGSATTGEGGYFRQVVTFPPEVAPGFWELRASAPGGVVAVTIFEAEVPSAAAGPDAGAQTATTAAAAQASSGTLIDPNLVVMLVLLLLVVAVGGAATFVWYQTHRREGEPGMGTGDDPIWSGASGQPQ